MSFPSYREFDIKRLPDTKAYGDAVKKFFEKYDEEIKKDGENSTDKR